jgi:hypothetical protein
MLRSGERGRLEIRNANVQRYHSLLSNMAPRIPKARPSEVLCYGIAGVGAFAPFWFILPGAEERLAAQTARWAPRWEKNISYVVPRVERGIKRVEPPVSRAVRSIDRRLPLEKFAQGIDRRIKTSIERLSKF